MKQSWHKNSVFSSSCFWAILKRTDKQRTLLFGLLDSDPSCTIGADLDRWRWLKEDASSEQWERAGNSLDVDAEIDAMRRGE